MNGYKNRMGEVYQNNTNTIMVWYHRQVEPGQIFGRVNGTPFITDPFISNKGFMPMMIRTVSLYQNGNKHVKWVFEHPENAVRLIVMAFKARKVRLFNWESHVNGLTAIHCVKPEPAELSEKRDLRMAAKNSGVGGKVSHRTKAFRSKEYFDAEYVKASKTLYGKSVEIGGKHRKMTGSVASYIDGAY